MWIVDTGSHKANLAPGEASLELRYSMELPRNEQQLKIAQSDEVLGVSRTPCLRTTVNSSY